MNGSGRRTGPMVMRVYALLAVLVAALVSVHQPAFAADAVNLRVRITGAAPVQWVQTQQDVNYFQIGVKATGGAATAVTVRADLSDVAGQIAVVGVVPNELCSQAGWIVTCSLGALEADNERYVDLLIKPVAGVIGPIGRIIVRAASAEDPDGSDNAASRSLDVSMDTQRTSPPGSTTPAARSATSSKSRSP